MSVTPRPHPASLDVFVARQPIFDRRSELYGYELLFRSSLDNQFTGTDQDAASLAVIANSFFGFGIETLTGRGRAFINFARGTLLNEYAYVLPRHQLVVEILEDIEPDDEVVAACERLKRAGYLIALDDFNARERSGRLHELADIIKIDFAISNADERAAYARDLARPGVNLLAEKVETRADFDQAMAFGYAYVQGYFFARPEIRVGRSTPGLKATRLEIMRELNGQDPDLDRIEDQFKRDPALSYKLLRYVNSAAFGLRSPVRTVGRALAYLGQAGVRAFGTVMILADIGTDRPFELVVTSAVRGRFCELIGNELGIGDSGQDLFLVGLFSLLDALTGHPLAEALSDLPLSAPARAALLGENNQYRQVLTLAESYERGRWTHASATIAALGLTDSSVPSSYLDAVSWGNQIGDIR